MMNKIKRLRKQYKLGDFSIETLQITLNTMQGRFISDELNFLKLCILDELLDRREV